MPARRFFSMLKSSRQVEEEKRSLFLSELCDVSYVSACTHTSYENVRNYFLSRAVGGTWKRGGAVKMDYKDPHTTNILKSMFDQKRKVEGHG